MANRMFGRVALIGLGLIGSSLSHIMRRAGLAKSEATRKRAVELGLCNSVHESPAAAAKGADLVVLCVPVGVCGAIAEAISASLSPGAILTDVGSVKAAVIRDVRPHVPESVHFIPGHPIA